MNIASKAIIKALSGTLSYYFENFDKDAFKLGFGKEHSVHMEDIVINNEFIKDAIVLPNLRIIRAATNSVDVTIPWTNLNSQPIIIEMDKVTLDVEEYPPDFDKEAEERRMLEKRKKKQKDSSYGFIARCMDGVKMFIKEMNFSMKINGYRNNPSVLKATFRGMHVFSADKSWNPIDLKSSFSKDQKEKVVEFLKVLTCRKIDVSFIELPGPDAVVTKEAFIMRDCPVECRARIKKDLSNARVLCGTFDMLVRDVEVVFSDKTWKGFMEFVKGVMTAMTRTDLDYGIGKLLEDEDKKEDPKATPKKDGKKETAAEAAARKEKEEKEAAEKLRKAEEEKAAKEAAGDGYVPRPASSDDRTPDVDWPIEELDTEKSLTQTSFNMYISDAMMYCLNDEDSDSTDPSEDAFLKGYLHDMRCHLVLPPVGIDWKDARASKKLVHMGCTVRSCALTGVERIQTKSKIKKRQLVLATDIDNEALKRRGDLRKKQKAQKKADKKAEKEAAEKAKEQEGKKMSKADKQERRRVLNQKDPYFTADYVHEIKMRELKQAGKAVEDERVFMKGDWVLISDAADDQNMEKWLRSLFSRIKMACWSPQMLFASAWWARAMRFFEISSLSTVSVDAEMLIRLCVSGSTYDAMCTFPLQSFADKFGYRPIEPIAQASRGLYKMYSPRIDIGRMILGDDVTGLFRSARPELPQVIPPPMNLGKKSELELKKDETPEGVRPYLSMTENSSVYDLERMPHIRKPTRYQMKIHKAQFEIDGGVVFKDSDLCGEIVLHRLYETDQLMMEILTFIHNLEMNLSYRQYFLFHHFTDYVVDNTFIAVESVLLRKFGPARIQTALLTQTAEEVAATEGRLPVILSSKYWVDKMKVKVLSKSGSPLLNVVLRGVEGNSNNSRWIEKGCYEKLVNVQLLEIYSDKSLPTDDLTSELPDSHLKILKEKMRAARKRGEVSAVKGKLLDWEKRDCGVTLAHVRGNIQDVETLEELSLAREMDVLRELDEKIVAEIQADLEGSTYDRASSIEGGGSRKKGVAEIVATDVKFNVGGNTFDKIPEKIVRLIDEFLLIEINE